MTRVEWSWSVDPKSSLSKGMLDKLLDKLLDLLRSCWNHFAGIPSQRLAWAVPFVESWKLWETVEYWASFIASIDSSDSWAIPPMKWV